MRGLMQVLVAAWLSLSGTVNPVQTGAAQRSAIAALQRARPSPHEQVTRHIGGADITVVYGRPSMRGRKIFGGLVPFDRLWCPGADESTTLSSTRPMQLAGLSIPPGPHTVWTLPTADKWTLIISKDPSGFHTRHFPERDLGRVDFQKRALQSPVEQLTFDLVEAAGAGNGTLLMSWDNLELSAPFHVQ